MTTTPQSMSDLPELLEMPSLNQIPKPCAYPPVDSETGADTGSCCAHAYADGWNECRKAMLAKPTQPAATRPVPGGEVDWTGEDSVWKSGLYDRWNDYAKELGYTGICAALADIPMLRAAPVSTSREVEALVKDTIKREMAAWSDASQRDKDIARLALTSFSEKFDKAIGRLAPVQEKSQ